jgi:phenylpropionate dioxygenase-like ring-hydroxylating dioxygenase large terminal subunit
MRVDFGQPVAPPPTFAAARTRRTRARAAGMNPNHWYAVEQVVNMRPGTAREVVFWKRSIALFRAEDGRFHAIEDRCAHRQLKLSRGEVVGCHLVCPYHGWEYDGHGRVARIPHETFGIENPKFKIQEVPLQVRYGLVFLFPGDPELAERVPMPEIPQLEGPDRWVAAPPLDYTWRAHHSMILDNVSDYQHGYLHRDLEPFKDPVLRRFAVEGDTVHMWYRTAVGGGRLLNLFVPRDELTNPDIELCYEYPYHWSNSGDMIRHFMFTLPIDERTTRIFFLLYYRKLRIPGTRRAAPRPLMEQFLRIGNRTIVHHIFEQDRIALEAEQHAYDTQWDGPAAELNPVIGAFQDLTVRRWEEYLASRDLKRIGKAPTPSSAGEVACE